MAEAREGGGRMGEAGVGGGRMGEAGVGGGRMGEAGVERSTTQYIAHQLIAPYDSS